MLKGKGNVSLDCKHREEVLVHGFRQQMSAWESRVRESHDRWEVPYCR
jgi:hypothetical protein